MVPWISRIARPVGVWSNWGKGFDVGLMLSFGARCSGIAGMMML